MRFAEQRKAAHPVTPLRRRSRKTQNDRDIKRVSGRERIAEGQDSTSEGSHEGVFRAARAPGSDE